MADKTIGSLPAAPDLYDDSLLAVEQQGQAAKLTGAQLKGFAREGVSQYVQAAQDAASEAMEAVGKVGDSVEEAKTAAQTAQEYSGKPPVIQNGTWWTWDAEAKAYQDTQEPARLVVKGIYDTLEALQTAHPAGQTGDAYAVGTPEENDVYLWDADTQVWKNIGPLRGPEGPEGKQGPVGPEGKQGPIGPQGPPGSTEAADAAAQAAQSAAEQAAASAAAKQDKLTGTAGQVVGFDAGGEAAPVQGWSNPNLLDNAYWAQKDCIINQLGQDVYTVGAQFGITIDRWHALNLTVTLEDGWLKLHNASDSLGYFLQQGEPYQYDALVGSTISISALYRCNQTGCAIYNGGAQDNLSEYTVVAPVTSLDPDNEAHIATAKLDQVPSISFQIWQSYAFMVAPGATVWLKAAKLELGNIQTLARKEGDAWVLNDPPPNKALELVKCQRYMLVLPNTGDFYTGIGFGAMYQANELCIDVPTPASLRARPTVTMSGTFVLRGAGKTGVITAPENTSIDCFYSKNTVTMFLRSNLLSGLNLTNLHVYSLLVNNDPTAKIIFDSNL